MATGFRRLGRLGGSTATVFALVLAGAGAARAQDSGDGSAPQSVEDLRDFSIEQLSQIQVTSVAKRAEALSDAPAAIYVITHEDILRSGATTLPEILRLAPNLQVMQVSPTQYVITARGFVGNSADQSFSDKLLVLIDGRSVYSPLYSGVYWDMQDIPPDDIERIEVISGPGATLWGANAVNGVINIITRKATATQGLSLDVGGGDLQGEATLQYGGQAGQSVSYRVYARDLQDFDTVTPTGAPAHDHAFKPQAGFRVDWTESQADAVTVQGDGYRGSETQVDARALDIAGGNLLGRWTHSWQDGDSLQVQTYWDHVQRGSPDGGGNFNLDTYDVDLQHSFGLGARNQIVWGGGFRISTYDIQGTSGATSLLFVPASRTLKLADIFAQDTIALLPTLKLTLGLKGEDDPYSGMAALPDARLSWKPDQGLLLWAAASRAIRAPTPFDEDVVEKLGSLVFITGSPSFKPETVNAYELGARAQPTSRLSISISGYYNDYDDLRTIELNPTTVFPLYWGNGLKGRTEGLEIWGEYRALDWWRLTASYDVRAERLAFKPGASGIEGVDQDVDDPAHQASVRSSMNLGPAVTLDADLRYMGSMPDPALPSYVEADLRLAWKLSPHLELAASGFNLLHAFHQEYPGSGAEAVPRSVFAQLRWRY